MQYRVISADDHIDVRFFPADLWTARAPARLRDRVPRIEYVDGIPYWVCDGKRWGRWGQYRADGPRQWALERGGVMHEGELRPSTPALRLADMDRDGVDATIMYGPTDPFYADDPDLRLELYRGYNSWLEEFTAANPERLIGASQIPLDDPAAAAQEMERVARLGARHVNLMAARAEPPIWHRDWEPFWSIAEDSGIPVGFHLAVLTFNRPDGEQPTHAHPLVDRAAGGFRTNSQLVEPICGMIFGGVLDRHPRAEGGHGRVRPGVDSVCLVAHAERPAPGRWPQTADARVFQAPDLDDSALTEFPPSSSTTRNVRPVPCPLASTTTRPTNSASSAAFSWSVAF